MKRRRWIVLVAAVLLAALLAFALRDVIRRTIVVPLAYLWWVGGIYYRAVPQLLFWILLVLLIFLMAVGSLIMEDDYVPHQQPKKKPIQGAVESLAVWMAKSRQGNYFKWLIANRLGRLARDLLAQRESRELSQTFGPLRGRDWSPRQAVREYLEVGLNGSFADYPRRRNPFLPPPPTPLDLDPQEAIEFMESQMEMHRGRHS